MYVCGWIGVEAEIPITVDSRPSLSLVSYTVLICLTRNLQVLKKGTQTLLRAPRFTIPLPYVKP